MPRPRLHPLCKTGGGVQPGCVKRIPFTQESHVKDSQNQKSSMDQRKHENRESLRDKAGDLIEKAGHKISEAGAPKVGQKIHDLGDKLEKSHKNPSHPHRV